jgi:AcrR family transcriptional regulator
VKKGSRRAAPATHIDDRPRPREIVGTATELFAKRGYHAVGMRAIAAAVGVQTASLYNHFPAKSKILHTIALRVTRDFLSTHLALLDAPGSRAERLFRLIREHIRFFWEHRLAVSVMLAELRALDPADFDEIQAMRRSYQRAMREFIAAGVREGEFDVPDASVSTLAILDMINGIVRSDWFDPGGRYSIDEFADLYAALAVENLLRAKSLRGARARRPGRPRRSIKRASRRGGVGDE